MNHIAVEERLTGFGFSLPGSAPPTAEYIQTKQIRSLLFVLGQGPIRDGRPVYVGQVGAEVTLE